MDYLNYTYNGNQVVSIADIFTPSGQTGVLEYANLSNGQNEMVYDKNGGLIADFDRNICTIRKNVLSLPDTIQFVNGNQIVHRYDAMGRKLQTTYYRKRVQGSVTDYIISAEYYNENICYTRPTWNNGRYLHRVSNPEGCMWYL